MRVRGRYRNQTVELAVPLSLEEGTEIEIEILISDEDAATWQELGMNRLEAEWDNPEDAIYDNWKELYGDPQRG